MDTSRPHPGKLPLTLQWRGRLRLLSDGGVSPDTDKERFIYSFVYCMLCFVAGDDVHLNDCLYWLSRREQGIYAKRFLMKCVVDMISYTFYWFLLSLNVNWISFLKCVK